MESTPGEFVFTAKMPGVITHERRLEGVEVDLVEFLTAMEPLGSKLGPILIQLPPSYSVRERGKLEQFFRILPEEFEYAVEFRHRSWLCPQTLDLLRSYRVSWAITDIHYMPIVIETTAPFTYLRWLGRRSDVARLDRVVIDRSDDLTRWARELDRIGESSIRIYGYMNNHYAGHSPASIGELQRKVSHETTDPQTLWPRQTSLL